MGGTFGLKKAVEKTDIGDMLPSFCVSAVYSAEETKCPLLNTRTN
jgi:hypothetical protein